MFDLQKKNTRMTLVNLQKQGASLFSVIPALRPSVALGGGGKAGIQSFFLPAFFLMLALPSLSFAVARYAPGETLNPACGPNETDCTVSAPALAGANTDITSLTGLTIVGIGTTSPFAKLSIQNGGLLTDTYNPTLFTIASSTNGTATTTAFTVLANGNVGVGTAAPLSKLSVGGAGATDYAIYGSGGDGSGVRGGVYGYSGGSGSGVAGVGSGAYTYGVSGTSNYLGVYGSGSTFGVYAYSSSGHDFYGTGTKSYFAGNIGIGTTSPSAKLSVKSTGQTTGRAFVISDSANVERVTVLDNGNVGIGTSNPQNKLDINGNIQVRGYIDAVTKPVPMGTWRRQGTALQAKAGDFPVVEEPAVLYDGGIFKMWYKARSNFTTPYIGYAESTDGKNFTSVGGVVVANAMRPAILKNGSIYYMYVSNGPDDGTGSTRFDLYTSTDGLNFTLDTAAVLSVGTGGDWDSVSIDNKYVWIESVNNWKMMYEACGIGVCKTGLATSNDGRVWTKSANNPVINITRGSGRPWVTKVGSYYYTWIHSASSAMDIYRMRSTDLVTWNDSPSIGPVFFRQGDDEGEFSSSGQVVDPFLIEYDSKVYLYYTAQNLNSGTSPERKGSIKVAVASKTLAQLVATNEDAGSFYVDNVNTRVGIGTARPLSILDVNGGVAIGSYAGVTAAPSNGVILSGNIGIGTTTPLSKLQVSGALPKLYLSDTNGALDSKHWFMENNAGVLSFGTTTDAQVVSATRALSITNAGNVGIGTMGPGATLDVVGAIRSSSIAGGLPRVEVYDGSTIIAKLTDDSTPDQKGALNLYSSGGLTTRIGSYGDSYINGKVGISTTSPWRTLSVNGTMSISGLTSSAVGNALCITAGNEVTTASVAACAGVSSLRFKHDILDTDLGLSTILNLHPVSFKYNEGYGDSGKDQQFGLIAEEVQKIDPRLIILDSDGLPTAVRYDFLPTILVKAVQELSAKVQTLSANVSSGASGLVSTITEWVGEKVTATAGYFQKLVVGTSEKPSGITLYDEVTKEPYCLSIANGATKTVAGTCVGAASSASAAPTSTSSPTTPAVGTSTPPQTGGVGDVSFGSLTPKITLLGNNPAEITLGSTFIDPGATAVDSLGQSLMPDIISNTVDTTTAGTYQVIWEAHDSQMNTATSTRIVNVVDQNPSSGTSSGLTASTTSAVVIDPNVSTSTATTTDTTN